MKKIIIAILRMIKRSINMFLSISSIPICFCARYVQKKYDIGIGPVPLINNVYFSMALKGRGYKVETFVNDTYFIVKDFDYIYDKKNHPIYNLFPPFFLIRCIFRYKCLYIYFNGGPLGSNFIEPLLYKIAKVKTVVMPYGGDCQAFKYTQNKSMINALCKDYPEFYRYKQEEVERHVKLWSRNADIVIGHMDSVDYMYFWNRIIPCAFAIDTETLTPQMNPDIHDSIRIFHAPNHKNIKGTIYVEKAIRELKEEGYNIELVFRQNVSNKEIIKLIKSSDIVVDQLIMGWHGMFALEAMACGKPTICNIREDLEKFYINTGCLMPNELPIINATTSTIKSVLIDLIARKSEWDSIGKASRNYVVKHHSLEVIGSFFDELNRSIGLCPTNKN